MFHRKRTLRLIAASAAVLGASAVSHAAESGYEMRAYTNQPGGAEIMARDYEAAIEVASRSWPTARESVLGVSTNLCVAYTITRDFDEAAAACSKALGLSRSVDRSNQMRLRSSDEATKALINRGVLRAFASDPAGAASDFRAAISGGAEAGVAASNLEYLESSMSARSAVADATRN